MKARRRSIIPSSAACGVNDCSPVRAGVAPDEWRPAFEPRRCISPEPGQVHHDLKVPASYCAGRLVDARIRTGCPGHPVPHRAIIARGRIVKLEGSLATFPLRELIDMVTFSSVTGVLNIYESGKAGHLFFRDGALYHAERGAARGIDALAELLAVDEAFFSFVSDIVAEDESLWGAPHYFLQSAERAANRWRQIRPYVPDLERTPRLLVAPEWIERHVNPAHHPLLALVDGRLTLRDIAARLSWAAIDVAEIAAQLLLDGVIELTSASPEPPDPAPPARQSGLFDRLLASDTASPASPPKAPPPADPRPRSHQSVEDSILRLLRGSG